MLSPLFDVPVPLPTRLARSVSRRHSHHSWLRPPFFKMKKSPLQIVGVVLTYWTVSISMVFANKYLVGGTKNMAADISLFVAWFQCVSSVLFLVGISLFSRFVLKRESPLPPINRKTILQKNVIILSCLFVGMLTFNNLCLKHVGVAFFQVARSMTLIFTVIFSALILRKKASVKIVACCLLVAAGFFLGVDQEKVAGTLSLVGVIYGLTTSLFVSLCGIYTKKALDTVDNSVISVTFYNNFNAMFIFVPFVIGTNQLSAVVNTKMNDPTFWICLSLSGGLSFLIGWASNLQIDYTSPVTHHISNNSKAVLQTVLAVLFEHEFKRVLWWCSNLMVISGAFSYAMVKKMEMDSTKTESTAADDVEKANITKDTSTGDKTSTRENKTVKIDEEK
ncbi:GDP-fucose transporter 1-like isoform X2 [Tubulanus polymorphus]|uniref:GDP-fucose transporter 1-like isoform X2 n=1 Tax=Tubulanus polymorphus TaxID=672921 RepID=UPI003DA2E86C